MNVLIGWILLLITMSVFITFVFGYDLDLKDKMIWILKIRLYVSWERILLLSCSQLVCI